MKREELKAKGMTDEHIDFVLDEFHKEQEGLKGQIQTLTTERDTAMGEVKKYQQGGELYQDPTELETLRKFKTDTEAEKQKQTKYKAFESLLAKLNVRQDLKPLVTRMLDYDKITLTDKGEVDEAYEKSFTEELKAACPTAFVTPPNGTGIGYGNSVPGTGANGDGKPTTPTSAEWNSAIAAKTKIQ
jgi:hypothetical protein